jgi:hypothetical protein
MPALTRKLSRDRSDCWHVYFGDVHVWMIARCVGNPGAAQQWQWLCGFYPGLNPGEQLVGTAETFDQARAGFEDDWRLFSAKGTEGAYQAWRDYRDWTARKYAKWERGEKMSTQLSDR